MYRDFDQIVREWTPYAESWAYRMDRRHPGADFWPSASRAIFKAATTYDPAKGARFYHWFRVNLRNEKTAELRTWKRRAAKLNRVHPKILFKLPDHRALPESARCPDCRESGPAAAS